MKSSKKLFPNLILLALALSATVSPRDAAAGEAALASTAPALQALPQQTQGPVVHAVLFYHPTCAHCHQLITQYLIPLQEQHGSQLVILGMDTSQQWANNLYWEAIRHYGVPEDDWAVPMMVVGENAYVGGDRIPAEFAPILEQGLAGDGVDLPSFPALVTFLREQDALDPRYPDRLIARQAPPPEGEQAPPPDPPEAEETTPEGDSVVADPPMEADTTPGVGAGAEVAGDPSGEVQQPGAPDPGTGAPEEGAEARQVLPTQEPPEGAGPPGENVGMVGLEEAAQELESMTMWDRFNLDRTGNSISVIVLILMVISLVLRGHPPRVKGGPWPPWVIPALILVGAGVAAYLSYIEVTQTPAACGPVGDCNTVNQSKYATLFGFLPVGVLGLIGYGVILVSWVLSHSASSEVSRMATLSLWGAVFFGVLFSIYLTFLEPFVIGATCAWCLTSAVVMMLLLWAASPLASRVWSGPLAPSEAQ